MDEVSKPLKNGPLLRKTSRSGGPVTCVSLTDDGLVWARGPYLERQDNQQLLVFPEGGTIHGICHVVDNNSFDTLVFGSRQLAFCNVLIRSKEGKSQMNRLDVLQEKFQRHNLIAADWIWSVELLNKNDSGKKRSGLVIGMARNMVEYWHVDSSSLPLVVERQKRIHGVPCSITSMHLLPGPDCISIAAGTAFHKIHVWSIGKNESVEMNVESQCLEGHAGVVHSVQFSPDGLTLVSTSDDRSVRLWNYNPSEKEWNNKWVAWGHCARVWTVKLATGTVVSASEDGTTRVWSLSSGELLASIQHSCSLWTVDTLDDIVAVGATDGTVTVYDLTAHVEGGRLVIFNAIPVPDDRLKLSKPDVTDDVSQMNRKGPSETPGASTALKPKKKKKKPKKINMQVIVGLKWSEGKDGFMRLLLATRAGSVMSFCIEKQEWKYLQPWWDLSLKESRNILSTDGCCMAAFDEYLAIGTTRGDVVLTSTVQDCTSPRLVLSARQLKSVQGLVWINAHTLVSFHVRTTALWKFSLGGLHDMETPTFVLNMETKGVPMSCVHDEESDRIIVGDSRGNIGMFQLHNHADTDGASSDLQPTSLLKRVHQKEHVTGIALKNEKVLSVGNDGCLHTSYIHGASLRKGWAMPASSMTGVSHIWKRPSKQNEPGILVAGYYGNIFRMIDMNTGHEFFSVDTRGRQRIHDCWAGFNSSDSSSNPTKFGMVVCIGNQKDGTNSLMIHRLHDRQAKTHLVSSLFQRGVCMHGETIFSACLFSLGKSQRSVFLLTGSEDCTSKISLLQDDVPVESVSLTPQESCVRAVCSSQSDESSALLAIGGGKLALQFFLARANNEDLECLEDLEISFLGKGTTRTKATIDHRINAVKAVPLAGCRSHLVVAGDSDGNCHLFLVSEDTQTRPPFGLFAPTSSRPILCIEIIPVCGRLLVLVGTTGGDVLLFDLPSTVDEINDQWETITSSWSPMSSYRGHQMGTNTISASVLSMRETETGTSTSVFVCTGGDDQAVCSCLLSMETDTCKSQLKLSCTLNPQVTREASFSAIKGIAQFCYNKRRFVITVGYSQQLALWEYSLKDTSLHLSDNLLIDLGDINCLAITNKPQSNPLVVIGGFGVETVSMR